jgi:hypothetical protein
VPADVISLAIVKGLAAEIVVHGADRQRAGVVDVHGSG